VTDRLTLDWPDPGPFEPRGGQPVRLLAVSDEPDPALESVRTRQAIGRVDMIVGCGDLQPDYLAFVTDAFGAPLRYVRGNHDAGIAWVAAETSILPDPMPEAQPVTEAGVPLVGFSGSPRYSHGSAQGRGPQVSGAGMWWRVVPVWLRLVGKGPLVVVSHAAPRGLNDAPDLAHRGFTAFRWLVERLQPPLWLHGHTALVRRGIDNRCLRHGRTLLVNVTGATLIELVPRRAA
jgi:uncharacterized protein